MMPNRIAKLIEVSQFTILSPCPMKFHRSVTSDPVTSATANTVPNSTINFLMFIFPSRTGQNRNDYISLFVALPDIAVSINNLFQRIAPVDDSF